MSKSDQTVEVIVLRSGDGRVVESFPGVSSDSTIDDLKNLFAQRQPKYYPDRQSFRQEKASRTLSGDVKLGDLAKSAKTLSLYFKDLGPQIGWTTVFVAEYTGPLIAYLLFYCRPALVYGPEASSAGRAWIVQAAAACWVGHYAKRILETLFVHRFSHGTMPWRNLFKNCGYYWGFAAFVSYFVNHPSYTPPAEAQSLAALAAFGFCQLGNLSCHLALRNLRPPGTKQRRIPYPTANPFTWLFGLVSCPNYTYEIGSWLAFTVATQCLPAGLFTLAGAYQMTVWALGKHRNYRREFPSYPRGRKSILPFVI